MYHKGEVSGWMISAVVLIVLFLAAGAAAIWLFLQYNEQKTNVQGKVDLAVAEARKDQSEKEEAKYAEREKEPRREFAAPDDLGRLSFTYPKTWSSYVDKDPTTGGGNEYRAYLHPLVVPSVNVRDQKMAIRVSILQQNYDRYLKNYDKLIEDGKLRSTTVSINGENAVRLDGNFSDTTRGAAVIFKIRDKTAIVQTDADLFLNDFNTLVATIKFSK